jgi:hypothetical protein
LTQSSPNAALGIALAVKLIPPRATHTCARLTTDKKGVEILQEDGWRDMASMLHADGADTAQLLAGLEAYFCRSEQFQEKAPSLRLQAVQNFVKAVAKPLSWKVFCKIAELAQEGPVPTAIITQHIADDDGAGAILESLDDDLQKELVQRVLKLAKTALK